MLGVLWQVVQVPVIDAGLPMEALSLSPRTPVMMSGWVLKIFSPAAISRFLSLRAAAGLGSDQGKPGCAGRFSQAVYSEKAFWLKLAPSGLPARGSFMPGEYF